jgi:hypothetical protein
MLKVAREVLIYNTIYRIIPITLINWDRRPSRYAEYPDYLIFI